MNKIVNVKNSELEAIKQMSREKQNQQGDAKIKMKIFKQWLAVSFISFFTVILPAHAQGMPTIDVQSIIRQIIAYTTQVEQYTRQGLQLQAELKNLVSNPASLLGSDVGRLINGVGSIMSATKSIGGNLASIDRNFANTFKNPQVGTLASNFTRWHDTSTATLEGALKAAGIHRDQFATDTDALTAMFNKSKAAGGNLQALQSLAEINAMQVQQTQKLQDLIATQNIAASTYMAAQTAKDERVNFDVERYKRAMLAKPAPSPIADTPDTVYKKWNLY